MNNGLKTLLMVMTFLSPFAMAAEKKDINIAFHQLKSLVGSWTKEGTKKTNFTIQFELIANSSTLIETWFYNKKKHSLTTYHLDGDKLMATHYCPQGNQPRLYLTEDSTLKSLSFSYFDATNLTDSQSSHQHSLGFELSSSMNKIVRKESYLNQSNEEDHSSLILVRLQEKI